MNYIKKPEGQIMVVTLLVLTVIIIIVVSVVLVVGQDVEQQVATREYEKYLDQAEKKIIDTISLFDVPDYDLSTLVTNPGQIGSTSCTSIDKGVNCNFVDEANLAQVDLEIRDTKNIEEYVLGKDELFTMNLGDYDGRIRVSWTGNTAMAFSIDFMRNGEYMTIKDVYDGLGIFEESGNDPLNDNPPALANHPIEFRQYLPDTSRSTEFTISETQGLLVTDEIINLSYRPIIEEENSFTLLDVVVVGNIDDQMRIYTSTGYASDVATFGESPAPTVITKIPLYPQVPSLFDYVLLTSDGVNKNP
jgi:hypothetical protein